MKRFFLLMLGSVLLAQSMLFTVVFANDAKKPECNNKDPFIRLSILPQVSDKFFESVRNTSKLKDISKVKACNRLNRKFGKITCKPAQGESREITPDQKCKDNEKRTEEFKYDKRKEIKIETAVQNRTCYSAPEIGSYQMNNADILGCAVITGDIRLWMVPYYVRYISDFLIAISGSIAVIVIIYGGYTYIIGSITTEGEGASRGKSIIGYGILGLVVILSAWTVVNVILSLLTS